MNHLVLLLATAALVSQSQPTRASNINRQYKLPLDILNEENGVDSTASPNKKGILKKFASVRDKVPKAVTQVAGDVLELTCEAVGSPAPSIQWFRNDEPISDHDLDSNEILETPYSSIGELNGKLIIAKPSPNEIDVYTCLVTAGRNTDVKTTTVVNIESNSIVTETDRHKLVPMAPKIIVNYKVYADTLGSSAILPCKVKGHPRPLVVWYNTNDVLIQNHSRMKVLKNGELSITNLTWSDMGEFTCEASNAFGKTTITTFVYPVRKPD